MASNAKIGLLLGLVVIFVIVFVINGLSGFDDLPPIVVFDPLGIKPDMPPGVFPPRRVPEQHPEETPPIYNCRLPIADFEIENRKSQIENMLSEPVKQTWPISVEGVPPSDRGQDARDTE